MRVLVISLNNCKTPLIYPEGPLYIAKQIEGKHIIKIVSIEFYSFQQLRNVINDFNPDLTMCSIRNIMNFNNYSNKVIGYLKHTNRNFIVGGPAITVFQKHAQKFLNLNEKEIFIGEFETRMNALFSDIENVHNINQIRMPDGSFLNYSDKKLLDDKRVFGIECKRGCPFQCIYCSYPYLSGRCLRKRDHSVIIQNIKKLLDLGIKRFFFTDAIFNIPRDYSLKLCKSIIDANIKAEFGAFINPQDIDEETASVWKKMNLRVELGVDGLSEKSLQSWKKPFTLLDVRKSIEILKNYNVIFNIYLMFGAPSQTIADVQEELGVLEEINSPVAEITVGPTIYPITELYKFAIKDRVVEPNELLIPAKTYIPPSIDSKKLYSLLDSKIVAYKAKRWGIILNQYTPNPTLIHYSR